MQPKLSSAICLSFGILLGAAHGDAASVTLSPDRDVTLIEDADGALALGAAPDFFVGRTNQMTGSVRRGAIHFDLSSIPRHAVIESVRLKLTIGSGNPSPRGVNVHALTAEWGEGTSFASGGGGAPSTPRGATWIHRVFEPAAPASPNSGAVSKNFWKTPGGDFEPITSATAPVAGLGTVVFTSDEMTADVAAWVKKSKRNFGWILIGDETAAGTVKRIASRQHLMLGSVPTLEVVYREKK